MTRGDKWKFRLAPVLIILMAVGLLAGLYALANPTKIHARHHKIPTYGFYNMLTLQFTMQYVWDAQLQGQGSKVTVRVACSRVLVDTAVCHGVASNGQAQDVGVQVTQHGNAFKVSQVR